ncbi:RES domain-containing protein [Brevibacillus sp. LEMMJ03]|uniref:RES family NAD+ phosphorylase n=1 Tax=Brevibacillus sp. LEMMJ03 TaxID=2595056 RepID=UPI0011814700|nr:RES family NAD+ phosphorylase [Brevibacillus sp. LEMMJ03]TRY26515.1 RES domain-containing protein [Brevibacillus sp. LEMMJ03]
MWDQNKMELSMDIAGCKNCLIELFEFTYNLLPSIHLNSVRFIWQVFKEEGIDPGEWRERIHGLCCPNCKSSLSLGDIIFDDEDYVKEEIIDIIAEHLSKDIIACSDCDDGPIAYEYHHGNPDNLREGHELCAEYQVPDDISDEVAERLQCHCGNYIGTYGAFVTQDDVKLWYSDFLDIALRTFDIRRDEASIFAEFLLKYPMLGIHHPIGQKIFDQIYHRNIPGICTMLQGTIFYRARARDNSIRNVPYRPDELWAPPVGIPSHGRFNPIGVPVLYLTSSQEVTLEEIKLGNREHDVAEIAEFVLVKNIEVWDVRDLDIKDLVTMPSLNEGAITREYIFPNFLAQCCAVAGINGLQYESVKDNTAWNLALFHYSEGHSIIINRVLENKRKDNRVMESKRKDDCNNKQSSFLPF